MNLKRTNKGGSIVKIIKLESSEVFTGLKQINGYWIDENNNR